MGSGSCGPGASSPGQGLLGRSEAPGRRRGSDGSTVENAWGRVNVRPQTHVSHFDLLLLLSDLEDSPPLLLPCVSIKSTAVEKRVPRAWKKQEFLHVLTPPFPLLSCFLARAEYWGPPGGCSWHLGPTTATDVPLGVAGGSPGPCLWGGLRGRVSPAGAEQESPCLVGLSVPLVRLSKKGLRGSESWGSGLKPANFACLPRGPQERWVNRCGAKELPSWSPSV